jgi:hypothetical protein
MAPRAAATAVKRLFLIVCIGAGAYWFRGYLQDRKAMRDYAAFEASESKNRPPSGHGFKEVLPIDGVNPLVMTVLMPCGCPLEAGQRGRALVERIKAAHIPVTASSEAHATINAHSKAEFDAKMALMNSVMNGETPIVLYKGRAKNNPTFDDVLAEYQTSQ